MMKFSLNFSTRKIIKCLKIYIKRVNVQINNRINDSVIQEVPARAIIETIVTTEIIMTTEITQTITEDEVVIGTIIAQEGLMVFETSTDLQIDKVPVEIFIK